MKKILGFTAACAVLALSGASVRAADLEVAAFDWSGFYGGLVAGYGFGNSQHCDSPGCSYDGPSVDSDGLIGGLAAGYNHQFDKFVLGIEADYMVLDMKGASGDTAAYGCLGRCATEVDSLGTARLRAGVAMNRYLPYLTAGVAVSDVYASLGVIGRDKTLWNFVAGAGLEYAATDRLSLKAEYLHLFDNGSNFVFRASCAAPGCAVKDYSADLLRVGVNLHF